MSATVLYSWAPTRWPEGWTRGGRQQQRRRNQASLELEALDDQEPLVEGGEAKLDGMAMGMTPIHASRER